MSAAGTRVPRQEVARWIHQQPGSLTPGPSSFSSTHSSRVVTVCVRSPTPNRTSSSSARASASKRTSYDGVPDVVVADVDLPDAQGAEAVRLLRLKFPASALLVLTLVAEPAAVQRVLDAGVDGYMLKSAAPGQFFFALRAVATGATYLQPSLGIELARAWSAPSAPARKAGSR